MSHYIFVIISIQKSQNILREINLIIIIVKSPLIIHIFLINDANKISYIFMVGTFIEFIYQKAYLYNIINLQYMNY